jgi:GntR family transcriptional regulator, transcriptional repressor for pyruvate dehydrogenase complex
VNRIEPGAAVSDVEAQESIVFGQVRRDARLSDKVADQIRETILAGRLRPGDRLPSERELGEQFGVSRTVVREAVRALVAKGMVEVRPGSGPRVVAVGASTVLDSMSLYLRTSTVAYPHVHEIRTTLEVQMAGAAAGRATPESLAALTEACERMEASTKDVRKAAIADLEFHRVIAKATGNELYVVLLDAIGDALLEIRRGNLARAGVTEETLAAHRKILDRIVARDADGARAAMEAHLDHVLRVWRTREGNPADALATAAE